MASPESAPRGDLKVPAKVRDEGFTELSKGEDPSHDIVFIHGLQGHPKKTWLYGEAEPPREHRFSLRIRPGYKQQSSTGARSPCFWPEDLLGRDFKNCRISTYGYDSRICNFFGGAANQANIFDHGRSLLHALEHHRREEASQRPIIFVVHSLGGLVLKDVLRRSRQAEPNELELKDIYDSTCGIIFMGTPHGGSDYANLGLTARKIAIAAGFDVRDEIIRNLKVESGTLGLLAEEFSKMLKEDKFQVFTFMEGKGFKGVRGLTAKHTVLNIEGHIRSIERCQ